METERERSLAYEPTAPTTIAICIDSIADIFIGSDCLHGLHLVLQGAAGRAGQCRPVTEREVSLRSFRVKI